MPDPATMLFGGATVLTATFLAGVVGFAYGLVALPLLLVVGVPLSDAVAVNLAVGLTTRVFVLARRHADVDRRRALHLIAGSVPGVGVGVIARNVAPARAIQLGAGLLSLVAVTAIAARRSQRSSGSPARNGTTLTAGALGGFLGVTTSLNGIPPALLLTGRGASARSMVADLAAYFVFGNLLTLFALTQSGHAPSRWVWSALAVWVPVGIIGNRLGTDLGPRLPHAFFRRLTMLVIIASGVASTIQALRGPG